MLNDWMGEGEVGEPVPECLLGLAGLVTVPGVLERAEEGWAGEYGDGEEISEDVGVAGQFVRVDADKPSRRRAGCRRQG
jgi:hypothetical protein